MVLTLLPRVSTIRLASVTHRHSDKQDSQIFTIENSIVKQPPINLQTVDTTAVTKENISPFATGKVTPLRVFGTEIFHLALTRPISTSFTKKQKEYQPKATHGRVSECHTHLTVMKSNIKLISDSQKNHSLKLGNEKEKK